MLCVASKFLLAATSIAPILLTLWFLDFSKHWNPHEGLHYIAIAASLSLVCFFIITLAKTQLEKFPVTIASVRTADKEIVGFIVVYLLPLINNTAVDINPAVLLFVCVLFFAIVLTSHSYHFNPLLGIMGYHFYEVDTVGGISYVLVTRKNIRKCKDISTVVQLSEYMILEAPNAQSLN